MFNSFKVLLLGKGQTDSLKELCPLHVQETCENKAVNVSGITIALFMPVSMNDHIYISRGLLLATFQWHGETQS